MARVMATGGEVVIKTADGKTIDGAICAQVSIEPDSLITAKLSFYVESVEIKDGVKEVVIAAKVE